MHGRARLLGAVVLVAAWLAVPGRPSADPGPPVASNPIPEATDVETRLFLIGDGGVPLENDPVLAALSREVAADPTRAVVLFLGDNIYPRGLPVESSSGRKEAERRIDAQIGVVSQGARGIFIPGNHDWDKGSASGLAAIRRQGEYLRRQAAGRVSLLPEDGCPGPVVQDVEQRLRLVLLDTQWWLHGGEKPAGASSPCAQRSEADVVDALGVALREAAGRHVLVAGHHPLASGGTHGGYFSWRDHIFPLRASKSWLWIPLPVVGSAYPLSRRSGVTNQDLSGPRNRKMREALGGVFAKTPPLAYAAGHEHNLQVLEGPTPRYLLVSGAGAFGHVTRAAWTKQTLYARAASGYFRMDVERSGRVRLAVIAVDGRGEPREETAFDMTAPPATQKPSTPQKPGTVDEPATALPPEQKPGRPESEKQPTKPPDAKPPDPEPRRPSRAPRVRRALPRRHAVRACGESALASAAGVALDRSVLPGESPDLGRRHALRRDTAPCVRADGEEAVAAPRSSSWCRTSRASGS
jgi:hypothetical protein